MFKKLKALSISLAFLLGQVGSACSFTTPIGFYNSSSSGGGGSGIIQSIQTGTITITSGNSTNTATISSVNTNNAIVLLTGITSTSTATVAVADRVFGYLQLTNGTTVTATRGTASTLDSATYHYTVLEFTSAAMNTSVQQGTISISSGSTTNTATISAVGSNAAVIWLGSTVSGTAGGGNIQKHYANAVLTNSTTVTATVDTTATATDSVVVGYVVLDLTSAVVKSVQPIAVTTGTSTATSFTSTISSVNTNNSIILLGGGTTHNSAQNTAFFNLQLTNGTTVTGTRNAGNTITNTYNATVLEFQGSVLNSSVQRGAITLNNVTSNTATISSVNTSKAICNWGFFNSASAGTSEGDSKIYSAVGLTNSTTVTANINTASTLANVVSYEILEFN